MTATEWHAPPADLRRFANEPRSLDDMTASSIEAHLVACGLCRAEVARRFGSARLAASWDGIADRVDRPRPTVLERLLPQGAGAGTFPRLVASTPGLQLAGLGAIAVLAFGSAAASRAADAEGPFLVLGPLAPLLAVAGSYAPAADPAGEAGIATALHGVGLVVRRSIAALVVSMVVLTLAAAVLPELRASAIAWVVPSLALAIGVLALGTWWRVEVALGTLAVVWMAAVGLARWAAGISTPTADAAVFAPAGQLTAAVLAALALVVVTVRRERFATMEAIR